MTNSSGDFTNWLPPYDPQHSADGHADADDCVSESAIHIIETLIYFQTGKQVRYSPRALAKLSNTQPTGNSIENVINAINTYGLIPYDLWQDLENFTWPEFYADIPQAVLDQADKSWTVSHSFIPAGQEAQALQVAPIWLQVRAGTGQNTTLHFVEQFNATQIFDSYQPAVKPITTYEPINSFQITIKPKNQPMYKKCVKADGKTFGVLIQTPNGDQIIYATDQNQWMSWSKPDSYGLSTVNADGTPNFSMDGVIQLPW